MSEHLTNSALAERLGVHYTTISRIRTGSRLPSGPLLRDLIGAFDMDPQEALDKYAEGREAFSQYLAEKIHETQEAQ